MDSFMQVLPSGLGSCQKAMVCLARLWFNRATMSNWWFIFTFYCQCMKGEVFVLIHLLIKQMSMFLWGGVQGQQWFFFVLSFHCFRAESNQLPLILNIIRWSWSLKCFGTSKFVTSHTLEAIILCSNNNCWHFECRSKGIILCLHFLCCKCLESLQGMCVQKRWKPSSTSIDVYFSDDWILFRFNNDTF